MTGCQSALHDEAPPATVTGVWNLSGGGRVVELCDGCAVEMGAAFRVDESRGDRPERSAGPSG